jgi:hypothetical protein
MRILFLTTAAFAALVMIAPIGNAHAEWLLNSGRPIVDWNQKAIVTKFCMDKVYNDALATGNASQTIKVAGKQMLADCYSAWGYRWSD